MLPIQIYSVSLNDIPIERIKRIVAESLSYREVLRNLDYCPRGRAHYIIRDIIETNNISTEHFCHPAKFRARLSDDEFFAQNVRRSGTGLKRRLLRGGYVEEYCAECSLESMWHGKPLSLQVDHINGDNYDCRLENLRLLCPNCHTQTSTFAGRRFKRSQRMCDCGAEISKYNKSGKCRACCRIIAASKVSAKFIVPKEQLADLLQTYSLSAIGRKFQVSANTVKKYCARYGLK